MLDPIKIGDRIKFRCVTRWSGQVVWRKVNGFWRDNPDYPTVRYGGWGDFVVKPDEIIDVEPKED
jgi:hypothetical protein